MYTDYKPWEWVSVVKDGTYSLVKADEETQKKQLQDYKQKRRLELEKELRELEMNAFLWKWILNK
jgi:nitroimidazol reductase NimA-like FMN-containing flavoprotein (pyridoxamine 5'-phosphate oxidase superfamily)